MFCELIRATVKSPKIDILSYGIKVKFGVNNVVKHFNTVWLSYREVSLLNYQFTIVFIPLAVRLGDFFVRFL